MVEILQVTKKIAQAAGCEDFNVLQNNGRKAHQEVDHVGFFLILPFPLGRGVEGKERERENEVLDETVVLDG